MDDGTALGQISRVLAPLDDFRSRSSALNKPLRGSPGAKSARRSLGHLHTIFAGHCLSSALDHLVAWRLILRAGELTIGAHLTLLRGALEGAATCRWLIDSDIDYHERIRRGAILQLEDWRQRKRFEESIGIGIDRPWTGKGMSGAARVLQHTDRMQRAGLIPEGVDPRTLKPDDMTTIQKAYGNESAWRLTSAFAHASPWSGMTVEAQRTEIQSMAGTVRVKVTAKTGVALWATIIGVGTTARALTELEIHHGRTPGRSQ